MACVLAVACLNGSRIYAADTVTTTTTTTTMTSATPSTTSGAWSMDDDVHMRIGLPLWALSMKGDVAIHDRQGHVDRDFWDFFDDLDFYAPLKIELRKNRFFFNVEGIYTKMGRSFEPRGVFGGPGTTGDLTLKQVLSGIDIGYVLVREPSYTLTAFAGGQVTYVKAQMDISAPAVGASASASKTKFFGDPIIGLYGTYDFNQCLGVYVKGQVGGFGVSGDHFTWEVEPGIDWRISPHTYARAEWRWLSFDFGRSNFEFDTEFMGPQVELGWRF